MQDDANDTALIDLAVAFFSTILVLFVFIEFSFDALRPPIDRPSIGQEEPSRTAIAPSWSAVNLRGQIGVLVETNLIILDLTKIGDGVVNLSSAYADDKSYQMFSASTQSAPNAFSLKLRFDPADMPAVWTRFLVPLDDETECPIELSKTLLVWIPREAGDLSPLLTFADRCQLRLRLSRLAPAASDGSVAALLALQPGHFSAASMFR